VIVARKKERATRDRGNTLVEILAAISLTSIAVLPIMAASWALVKNSALNRYLSKVETVVNNAADRVNRATPGCDYTIYVQAAALSQGWPATAASATYKYYVPGASATAPGTWTDGACPLGGRTDGLVQLVKITVTAPNGSVTRTIQVVKSDV
jgi:type II secretory pathway pseudopilin PulG